jgi:WD40 repeat protein
MTMSQIQVTPPSSVLLEHVAVYLDRCMFNRVALLNRGYFHQTTHDDMIRPWPSQRRFRVGSRAWSVAFSYDGRTIACGTDNGTVQIWYCSNGRHATLNINKCKESLGVLGGTRSSNSNSNSSTHRRRGARGAACGSGGTNSTMAQSRVTCVSYHPSPFVTLLAASGEDGRICLWKEDGDTATSAAMDNVATAPSVQAAALSGSGVLPPDTTRKHEYGNRWHPISVLQARGTVSCVVFVPPNSRSSSRSSTSATLRLTFLAAACPIDCSILLFAVENETCIARLPSLGPVLSLAVAPNGQALIAGGSGGKDHRLLLWNLLSITTTTTCTTVVVVTDEEENDPDLTVESAIEKGHCMVLYEAPTSSQERSDIRSIAYASNGQLIAFACGTRIGLYDCNRKQPFLSPPQRPPSKDMEMEIAVPNSNKNGIISSSSGIRSTTTDSCRFLKGHIHNVRTVSLTPNGEILTSACSIGTIRLWRVQDGLCLKKFVGHYDFLVCALAFPPINQCNGRSLLSAGSDGTIALWTV